MHQSCPCITLHNNPGGLQKRCLLQVWSFLHDNSELLTIENVPSLNDLEASLFHGSLCAGASPTSFDPAAAASSAAPSYLTVITPLLRLLAADVYRVVMEQSIDNDGDVAAQQKDLAAGLPQVDATNWRHVCAGLFAGKESFSLRHMSYPPPFIPNSPACDETMHAMHFIALTLCRATLTSRVISETPLWVFFAQL